MNHIAFKRVALLFIATVASLSQAIAANADGEQENRHYLNATVGGGVHTLLNKSDEVSSKPGFGTTINLGYVYFLNAHWGIGSGLGWSYYGGMKSILQATTQRGETDEFNHLSYLLTQNYDNWTEKQRLMDIEIPLGAYFRTPFNEKTNFMAGLGAKLMIPFAAKYSVTDGTLTQTGYYEDKNLMIHDLPHHNFGTTNGEGEGEIQTKVGVGLYADLGINHAIGRKIDLYTGIYGVMGLTDISAAHDQSVVDKRGEIHSVVNSDRIDKTRLFAAGVKVGLAFRFFKELERDEELVPQTPLDTVVPKIDSTCIKLEERINRFPIWEEFRLGDKESLEALEKEYKEKCGKESEKLNDLKRHIAETSVDSLQKVLKKKDVYFFSFNSDEHDFNNEETEYMRFIAECLKMNPDVKIHIVGHTCDIGTEEQNNIVGHNRANRIKNFMISVGSKESQITTSSMGNKQPIAPNTTEANRAKNRRAVISVVKGK